MLLTIKKIITSGIMISAFIASFAKENVSSSRLQQNNTNVNSSSVQRTTSGCAKTTTQTDLKVNNVRARIFTGGDMWWDLASTAQYEVPNGSGKTSLFAGSVWIGGYDANGNLKVAAQTYRQNSGNDFWAGPIAVNNGVTDISADRCSQFDKHWKVSRDGVQKFIAGLPTGDINDINSWPGNGNTADGELPLLAPFEDLNGNGIYEPSSGEYPRYNLTGTFTYDSACNKTACNDYVFGDATLWWVFNDVGNLKTETKSDAIGLEIRAQAFAFKTNDEISNMTFYQYQVINRGSFTFDSTFFGMWVDPDLGYYNDDFVGCDVSLGLGFCYNGDSYDDLPTGYGYNPPAIGVDFFQGPIADPHDGIDNNHNGIIDEPCEQIIMSKFLYYNNDFTVTGNPQVLDDYYQYLTGSWKDATPVTYGFNGYNPGSIDYANYMFPDLTDPNHLGNQWTEVTAGDVPGDRRFLQSAGPFTLQPGAVNYITVGAVWARTTSGGPLASVDLVKAADKKAQILFNSCFKTIDGPDAPNIEIRELDTKLSLTLKNIIPTFNKDVERYAEIDSTIPEFIQVDTNIIQLSLAQRTYNFEGYQLYQVIDNSVSTTDLADPSKARLIAQVDLKNGISQIVNWEFSGTVNGYIPAIKAFDGNDAGLKHSFLIDRDIFTSQRLINHKAYYFTVVSYAYNNYYPFVPIVPSQGINQTQAHPYLAGRRNVNVYSGIPHITSPEAGGMVLNVEYGDGPQIQRIEGSGNGGKIIDLTDESTNEAMTAPDYLSKHPVYQFGKGPLNISVYDPTIVRQGSFELKFDGVSSSNNWKATETTTSTSDTSDYPISVINEQLLLTDNNYDATVNKYKDYIDWGLTAAINQIPDIGTADAMDNYNNNFLEATQTFADDNNHWLTGLKYGTGSNAYQWIDDRKPPSGTSALYNLDSNGVYITVLGGTWTPYKFASNDSVSPKWNQSTLNGVISLTKLPSVDVVITSDKSKWSRAVVLDANPLLLTSRFSLRQHASVDKSGNSQLGNRSSDPNSSNYIDSVGMGWFPGYSINVETGERLNIGFAENPGDVTNHGDDMLWNPTSIIRDINGNAIFGGMHYIYIFNHNGYSANDIPKYDACYRADSLLTINNTGTKRNTLKDIAWCSVPLIAPGKTFDVNNINEVKIRLRVAKPYTSFNPEYATKLIPSSHGIVSGQMYVANSATVYNGVSYPANTCFIGSSIDAITSGEVSPCQNCKSPYYKFGTDGLVPTKGSTDAAKNALDLINVVPNPYYGYSSYEKRQLDTWVKFTNLPHKCTVSIYTLSGTLIRKLNRDVPIDQTGGSVIGNSIGTETGSGNYDTSLDWDLKNTKNVPINSGMYIIHINAPGLGERTLKWFAVVRPVDVDSY